MKIAKGYIRDNASFVLPRFEVRVWEAEEYLRQLMLLEEIWKKFHRIRPQTRNVLISTGLAILTPECLDLFLDKVCNLYADLHS